MNKLRLIFLLFVAFLISFYQQACANENAESSYVFAGSGSNISITNMLVKVFMEKDPSIRIKVLPSIGSTGGIKAVHKGKIDLALVSRPLRDIEATWDLKVITFARTLLVFVVNPSVPDDNITDEEIKAIYEGKKTQWKNHNRIIVIMREEGDSGAEVLIKHFNWIGDIFSRAWRSGIWRIEYREAECLSSIERVKDSIGWSDLGSTKIGGYNIKPLKLNGIVPSRDNYLSGKYPLYKELSFVYSGILPEPLQRFIKFIKSDEAREILKENGYEPVR